jgi:hypothetical protein
MKTRRFHPSRIFAALVIVLLSLDFVGCRRAGISYELGDAEFAPGDSITIQKVSGPGRTIEVGQTYCVEGTYTLSSQEDADLALFATVTNPNPTPIDPQQTVRVKKGTGSFRLTKTMTEEGYLHLTFYSLASGNGFGGVYFGQGKWVLRNKHFSYLNSSTRPNDFISSTSRVSAGTQVSSSGANRALFEYLGNPVAPPANMDPAYSREGLTQAMQLAARNAGIPLKKVEIEDSEFPFLVGVVCENKGDFAKLTDQIKKMESYEFSGTVDSHTCFVMNIVPWRAFPSPDAQQIRRRLTVRMEIFFYKINAQ